MIDAALMKARSKLEAERARLRRAADPRVRPPPGVIWRPTPSRFEANTTAVTGRPVPLKIWDGSPLDPLAFDPTQPPLPGPPPSNTTPPSIALLGTLAPGQQLAGATGAWTKATSYLRQWSRGDAAIAGETSPGYTISDDDIGFELGFHVVALNGNGAVRADADPVGPILPAGSPEKAAGGLLRSKVRT
jgi:hypothetical protein